DEKAPSLADQAIEAQRKGVTRQIDESKKELQRARDAMRRTEQELNRSEEFNDKAREKLSDFTERNETARATLAEIAAVLDTPLFQEASRQAETLATESFAQAQESADLVPVTDDKDERLAEATAAREKIEESIRDLDQLALTMREAEEDYRAISRLSALADRQQE